MAIIEVKNLTKKYGEFTAISNISFSIEKGTIVGFVGKNGAGKTTTIRCLLDFLKPTSGEIKINNLDANLESSKIKEFLGYMPSDSCFYESLTSKDIFKFCQDITNVSNDKIDDLCDYFELDLTKKIKDLSFGNKKKVSIIQSLLRDVEILILDEPTSGLDPLMQLKFFELLEKLKKEGKTIFLSSHNLAEIQKYCDRVLIIKDGEIIEDLDMKSYTTSLKQIVAYKTKDGLEKTFENTKEINTLLKELITLDLQYLEIKYTTVEDEFIKYYKE